MNPRLWAIFGSEQADGPGKRQVRNARTKHRAWRRRRIVTDDDSGRRRSGERLLVLAVGEKCEVAGTGIVNTRHAGHVNVSIALESTVEARGQLSQLHDAILQGRLA